MARAFTPSRNAIYGSPEASAWSGIADTMMGEFEDRSNDQIQLEYRRQMSNATIAKENERHGLTKFMAENQNDPGKWRTHLAQNKERIRKGILSGITQPDAKQQVELELNEDFAEWDRWLDGEAFKQTGMNANADYRTARQSFNQSQQYHDPTDAQARIAAARLHIQSGFNGGKSPVDDLPTEAVAKAEERAVTQTIAADFLVQQALALDNEDLLSNEAAVQFGLSEEAELFGPKELADLKKRYTDTSNMAKAQTKKQKEEMLWANEQQMTAEALAIEAGKATPEVQSTYVDRLISSVKNGELDAVAGRVLMERVTKPKEIDRNRNLVAYEKVREATDSLVQNSISRTEYQPIWWKYLNNLTDAQIREFIKDRDAVAMTNLQRLRVDAMTVSREILQPLFRQDDGQVEEPDLLAAQGEMAQRLDQWAKSQYQDETAEIDRSKFMDGAIGEMLVVRDEIRRRRGMDTPVTDRKNPTPQELRRQNTREAYEKGVALGYWK